MTQENSAKRNAEAKSLQWTGDLVQKFWDYQSLFPEHYFTSLYGDRIVGAVRNYVPRRARVLDYACGTGALTGYLLHSGFSVGACDLSPDSVAYVQKNYAGHPAFCGAWTIDDLLAGEERFDAVVLVELIEHVDDTVLTKVMADLRKLLAPDGMVIMTTPNDEDLAIEMVYCPCCNHTFHRWQHVRSWNGRTLAAFLVAHGLELVSTNEIDFSLSQKNGFVRYYLHRLFQTVLRRKQPHLLAVAKMVQYQNGVI
ncbi:class I SAM-dependent methyltransferase [Haematospirillum sp. 15-248]|uniref:class I SAM-dependent methyltransferase n=1 Tax=Haematospirillum sp. 15-248 TaxID=2723107 RepID=UPI00143BA5CB|nr:class I SAM-dependent methyltransferase [Haematospirillum sp. 15-248]NKD88713.1 class I SAM-dependent methyltransferase [Haematospirillum sp. 15-248]